MLLTLEEPTGPMLVEAAAASVYHSLGWNRNYPKIQIVTVAQLLKGARIEMLQQVAITFKQAQPVQQADATQEGLGL